MSFFLSLLKNIVICKSKTERNSTSIIPLLVLAFNITRYSGNVTEYLCSLNHFCSVFCSQTMKNTGEHFFVFWITPYKAVYLVYEWFCWGFFFSLSVFLHALVQWCRHNFIFINSRALFLFKFFSFKIYTQKYYIFCIYFFCYYRQLWYYVFVGVSFDSVRVILLVSKVLLSSYSFFGALISPHVDYHKYCHPSLYALFYYLSHLLYICRHSNKPNFC